MEMLSAAERAAALALPQDACHTSTGTFPAGLLAPEDTSRTDRAGKLEQRASSRRKTFPIAGGQTIADRDGLSFIQKVHLLRLPRTLSKLRSWEDIADRHVVALLEQHGEDAFKDRRIETKIRAHTRCSASALRRGVGSRSPN